MCRLCSTCQGNLTVDLYTYDLSTKPVSLRAHLDWVHAELLRDLIDRLDSSHRLKAYLGFEFRQVCVALLRFIHGLPVSLHSVPLKHLSQIRGPLQIKALILPNLERSLQLLHFQR